jgi:hypothetical protein
MPDVQEGRASLDTCTADSLVLHVHSAQGEHDGMPDVQKGHARLDTCVLPRAVTCFGCGLPPQTSPRQKWDKQPLGSSAGIQTHCNHPNLVTTVATRRQ